MLKLTICLGFLAIVADTANAETKPNAFQRAKVLSANALSITIEHSKWGKKIAFSQAAKHCESLNKVAVYQGSSQQYGPDVISTWRCE